MAPKMALKKTTANRQPTKANKNILAPQTPAKELVSPVLENAALSYAGRQDNEIASLQSILGDENLKIIDVKNAWNKTLDRAFEVRVMPLSYPDTFAIISVKFTASYPKTIPLLQVKEYSPLVHEETRRLVENVLKTKPKTLLDQEMIYELYCDVEQILVDAIEARERNEALPSLETERAAQEAAEAVYQEQLRQEEERQKAEAEAEAESRLSQMVELQLKKEADRKRKNRQSELQEQDDELPPECVAFDSQIRLHDPDIAFRSVYLSSAIGDGAVTKVITAVPLVRASTTLALKRVGFKSASKSAKSGIVRLDSELQDLRKLRHPNIIAVLDFKIETGRDEQAWEVFILTTFANKGSLGDMLEIGGTIPVHLVRSWTIELLEALHFYHGMRIIHGGIHPNNVLLCKTTGSPSVKLADAGFQVILHQLHETAQPNRTQLSTRPIGWMVPELVHSTNADHGPKADIWDLGIIFLQMLFGLDVTEKYASPTNLINELGLSEPLDDLIQKFFKPEYKSRPTAFDLVLSEFLRSEAPIYARPASPLRQRQSSGIMSPQERSRRGSSTIMPSASRYVNEWMELNRIGKGGFGEVVRARNRTDARVYAIKKITLKSGPAVDAILKEAALLSILDHPNVVRYYTAWAEADSFSSSSQDVDEDAVTDSEDESASSLFERESPEDEEEENEDDDFGPSAGGLDFISSSGYRGIEFGDSDDESHDAPDDHDTDTGDDLIGDESDTASNAGMARLSKRASQSQPSKTTLYIQMQLCERRTLRDLLNRDLYKDTDMVWRLFRQLLEGLAHIHSHGFVHRDLKPDNVFIDDAKTPRIGDFGLAKGGQYQLEEASSSQRHIGSGDMTRSIGTALYVAPEIKSNAGENYSNKVDMYSLGIMFFEMCYPLRTGMERGQVIQRIRERKHDLPADFETYSGPVQGEIIMSLLNHRPSERPSSADLLKNEKIPAQWTDDLQDLLARQVRDEKAPMHDLVMTALFEPKGNEEAIARIWRSTLKSAKQDFQAKEILLQGLFKARLAQIFQAHGAVEVEREVYFPRSSVYYGKKPPAVQALTTMGKFMQLPVDLTYPHALALASEEPVFHKTFAIDRVYRERSGISAPRRFGEADFDIASHESTDLVLEESEVIRVVDEIVHEFQPLASQLCFFLTHSNLIDLIMDFSRIKVKQRPAVIESVSKLGSRVGAKKWTWENVKTELRSRGIDVGDTSIHDLSQFDFKEMPEKAFEKIQSIIDDTDFADKATGIFDRFRKLLAHLKDFGVRLKIFISPLSAVNRVYTGWSHYFPDAKLYQKQEPYTYDSVGGTIFQCVLDKKHRDIFAIGGRYDKLVAWFGPPEGRTSSCHAVGMSLAWERIVSTVVKYQEDASKKSTFLKKATADEQKLGGKWTARRIDVLVASFDPTVLRTSGLKIVGELWDNNFKAELAVDARSPEELLTYYRDDLPSWIVTVKHDTTIGGKLDIRVRTVALNRDQEVNRNELMSYLRAEMRERDQLENITINSARQVPRLLRHTSHTESSTSPAKNRNVQVLFSQHKSKKSNKWSVIEAAHEKAQEVLDSYRNSPIAAIETKDDIFHQLSKTRLSDGDSWRQVIQGAPLAERQYLTQVHKMLEGFKEDWRKGEHDASSEGVTRMAFVYNFRTSACVLYDLAL